jgi:hypothetical protein
MQQYSAVESLVLLIQIMCILQPTSRITNLWHHLLLEIALFYFCVTSKCNSVFAKHGNTREVMRLTEHKMTLHMRKLPCTIAKILIKTSLHNSLALCAITRQSTHFSDESGKKSSYLGKHSVCGHYKVFPKHP